MKKERVPTRSQFRSFAALQLCSFAFCISALLQFRSTTVLHSGLLQKPLSFISIVILLQKPCNVNCGETFFIVLY